MISARTHDAVAAERWREHGRISRHRKLLERRARHARQRIQHVLLAARLDDVVEERAERRARRERARVRRRLHDDVGVVADASASVTELKLASVSTCRRNASSGRLARGDVDRDAVEPYRLPARVEKRSPDGPDPFLLRAVR